MKRSSFFFVLALLFSLNVYAQNSAVKPASNTTPAKKAKLADVPNLPYEPLYATDFEVASPRYSQMVMQLWKNYDDNTLDLSAPLLDENVEITLSSGTIIKGKKAAMEGIKYHRALFTSVKSQVHAVIPHTNSQNNETTVGIWGSEESIDKDGKKTIALLHEVWFFNQEGRVIRMIQFEQKAPKI